MIEIRFHGRGGQGTVLAAKMLADAVLRAGAQECLAIPEFGVERRGAPVLAYARVGQGPIRLRTRVYEPDIVVVVDPTLGSGAQLAKGLKPGGWILLNTDKSEEEAAADWPGLRLACVPARRIALAHKLGSPASPVVNTAICGALCALTGLADMKSLEAAIRAGVPVLADANTAAAREAYDYAKEKTRAAA